MCHATSGLAKLTLALRFPMWRHHDASTLSILSSKIVECYVSSTIGKRACTCPVCGVIIEEVFVGELEGKSYKLNTDKK